MNTLFFSIRRIYYLCIILAIIQLFWLDIHHISYYNNGKKSNYSANAIA